MEGGRKGGWEEGRRKEKEKKGKRNKRMSAPHQQRLCFQRQEKAIAS